MFVCVEKFGLWDDEERRDCYKRTHKLGFNFDWRALAGMMRRSTLRPEEEKHMT
jgi:hypothetical protein